MSDLKNYVDALFRHQRQTAELRELKEEILSNMLARRDDLIRSGMDAEAAEARAKEYLPDIDELIDGNQLTRLGSYRAECAQSALLGAVVFWILTLPLSFTAYAPATYLGLAVVLICALIYLHSIRHPAAGCAFLSVTQSRRRGKTVWLLWALFFAVISAAMAAVSFGSNVWFGRAVNITGPYELASIAVRFYLPLITIVLPITVGSFTAALIRNAEVTENAV